MPVVLLINPNTSQATTAMMHRLFAQTLPAGIDVQSATAARGVPMITTEAALAGNPALQTARLGEAVQACLGDGAQAVVIGGGPLSEAAAALAPRFEVPVISAVDAAARAMTAHLGLASGAPGTHAAGGQ